MDKIPEELIKEARRKAQMDTVNTFLPPVVIYLSGLANGILAGIHWGNFGPDTVVTSLVLSIVAYLAFDKWMDTRKELTDMLLHTQQLVLSLQKYIVERLKSLEEKVREACDGERESE